MYLDIGPRHIQPSTLPGPGWSEVVIPDPPACPAAFPSVEHMGIDHRGADILVPEKFLYRPDVVSILKQVCGKRMTERVAARGLGDPRVRGIRSCAIVFNELFAVSPPETCDVRMVPSHR